MKEVKIQIPDNCEWVKDGDNYVVREIKQNPLVAMTVQEVIDALEKVRDKSKLVTTGETGGTIIQVIDTSIYVFLNKAIYNEKRECSLL